MSGCCSGPARIVVEFDYLTVDGDTCERCGDTRDAVRAAVADARAALPSSVAMIDYLERELTPGRLADSNRVLVNASGRGVAGRSQRDERLPSCGELVGEPVCCREIEVAGVRTEAVGRDVVFDAIMAAAGLAGEEGSAGRSSLSSRTDRAAGASSRPAEPASTCCTPAEPRITLVTGPGCG